MVNTLSTVKNEIKNSIEQKGVVVTDGMIKYADYIRSITDSGIIKFAHTTFNNSNLGDIFPTAIINYLNNPNLHDYSYMFYSGSANFDFPYFDASSATNMSHMFSYWNHYNDYSEPEYGLALIDTSNVLDMSGMFLSSSFNNIPLLDTSSVVNMSEMFAHTQAYSTIPMFNTYNVLDMSGMFEYSNIETLPSLDTSNVKNMSGMFRNCGKLITAPYLNTSSVENMSYMFSDCSSLTTVPLLDTSSVKDMSYMFYWCEELQSLPLLDTSNVENMSHMFYRCKSLTTIPAFDTSRVKDMSYLFRDSTITNIPLIDCSSVINVSNMFTYRTYYEFGGFKNLGMQEEIIGLTGVDSFLYGALCDSRESILNILNNLYDRASAGMSNIEIQIPISYFDDITDEDIAMVTGKGWIIIKK